ncbi:hypothetical protein [Xanthomonas populi]|uniref:hypothetical protein n=1 Tax=Xanthomonas populi TaxID=53414 RepID=UPI00142E52B0|nr:hypothetical protein [Xanthomonas populi]
MSLSQDLPNLEKTPAADIKVKGWPSLMRKVRTHGAVVITTHNHQRRWWWMPRSIGAW